MSKGNGTINGTTNGMTITEKILAAHAGKERV